MQTLICRNKEKKELEEIFRSKKAEFVLVYGRRRIGKTFLIKQFFETKSCIFFYVTGIKDGLLAEQLQAFMDAVGESFYQNASLAVPKSWMGAFAELNKAILNQTKSKKIVLFMDEFPWMATRKSRLIQVLEYYWNRHWCDKSNLKLIICGSSAAWIVKKILYNKGGLHNRITKQIILKPFNLQETKHFLDSHKIKLTQTQILQIYLIFGGVPFYLEQLQLHKSIAANVNNLCFKNSGILFEELHKLFQSLFDNHEDYLTLVKTIAASRYGMSRNDIEETLGTNFTGGRLTERLGDLEMAGFTKSFLPLAHASYGLFYRLIDEFCFFYLKWVLPEKATLLAWDDGHNYWQEKIKSPSYQAWSGYAFELLCYKHVHFIKKALHVLDDARTGVWRYVPRKHTEEKGAQIDLLFDQSDSIIICEIKYSEQPFVITKDYSDNLINKRDVFIKTSKTKKQVFIALIASSGIKPNPYSDVLISGVVTLEDFFN